MKQWIIYGMGAILIIAMPCQARKICEREKTVITHDHHQKRKEAERRYAARMIAHAKKRTERSRAARNKEIQDTLDLHTQLALQADIKNSQLNDRHHFASLIHELSTPHVTQRPMLEIIHEAECTLQQVGTYNPKLMHRYQAQLEQALKNGRHPLHAHEKKRYSNTDIMARQSVQSLVEYTHSAAQLVDDVAQQSAEIKCDLMNTIHEQQKTIANLKNEMTKLLNKSEKRVQKFNEKVTAFNVTLAQAEHDAALKKAEAINLEEQLERVTQLTQDLTLRLQKAESDLGAFENQLHQTPPTTDMP